MASIRREDMQRVTAEFRKMAEMADILEDAGDLQGSLAVRVALYDRVQETLRVVEAKIAEEGMSRSAGKRMTREAAIPWAQIGKGLKGLGEKAMGGIKGLWGAMKGEAPEKLQDLASRPGVRPGIQKGLQRLLDPKDVTQMSSLGRGLAIGGVGAAGLYGGSKLLGGGSPAQQNPTGPGAIPYPGASDSPGGWQTSGGSMGREMPPMGGGPMGGSGMGGGDAQTMQALQGIAGKVQELDGRVRNLESGGQR
jgi:hypothetical protein